MSSLQPLVGDFELFPSSSSIDNGLTTGMDGAALEKLFHRFTKLIAIGEVIIDGPFLDIDPVFSFRLDNFHGNHQLSKENITDDLITWLVGKDLNRLGLKQIGAIKIEQCRSEG